ncbi:reticulon-4-interacting protein 1 homolog, mitochondrial-like isoform X2 [Hydractinia symbiolongicarpus]|nr:reticulon-4-interacting protein 1 homolog, mitochondrial-like isoform X2 [Hydractinia symbiolongicarpus]XP_057298959.1 reticulon-4-interacting protein 1 homolog, mitochondrial-like isoform X2 [Hydractinia symbiolongicarpus]XP_057298960.1 reticulon-4-interacting protein 1 homolog, mitochondrial-like isoform X2 [Hydractinia symbiolongicarpus]XP_057298963.1 reticulon-4-interacting protein 1 homolog, mitochondrial-like isoform X2 [Hydractinia symbiolongicarpus]XP_057298964.1 reticulon-4-interact
MFCKKLPNFNLPIKKLKCSLVSKAYHLPSQMKCVELNKYADCLDDLKINATTSPPTDKEIGAHQALIKVMAASINPFDIEMTRGYGREAMNVFRRMSKYPEFPLILGRDCSGIVIKRGKRFRRFKVGDAVTCVRWIDGQGTHAEYVVVNKCEMSLKPCNLTHTEASSFPYVGCTTWNALIHSGVVPITGRPKKVFIPGGTGGIGSFAVQLCQSFGHDVFTTCATDGIKILNNIGIKNVIDYTSTNYLRDLESCGPFDVMYDTLNEKYFELFKGLLRDMSFSSYVSLRPTLLPEMDEQGVALGLLKSGGKFLQSNLSQLSSGKGSYRWGFFTPNALMLDQIRPLIESGKIKPLIDKVFTIDDALDAYKHVAEGHTRGKTIIKMTED